MAVMASNQFTIKDLNDVTVATTQPSSPVNGQAWLDTSTTPPSIKVWNGTAWIKGSPTLASEIGGATTGDLNTQIIRIDDMMNDMKVTPLEKDELKRQWEQIKAEYTQNISKGSAYGVATSSYTTAYNALNGTSPRIETDILANMTTTYTFASASARDLFNTQLTAYWTQKEAFLKALADKQKALADSAQGKADDAFNKITPVIGSGGLLLGTKLSPNTVTATSIVIGDFTNMVAYNEVTNPGGQATTTVNSKVYFKSAVAAWSKISYAVSATKDFKKGDNFYFSFYGYKDAAVANAAFVVRYYYTDGTWTNAGRVETTAILNAETFIEQGVPITADPTAGKTLNLIEFFIEKDATTTGSLYLRELELRLMNKGNLIVDGSIYGKTITGGLINSALIRNAWTDASTSESGFIELATKAKGSNTPQLTVSYTSPGAQGTTELYGFGMKIKAMGYDLIFNNFNSTMGIDAYGNDLRMGSSKALRFFPDWNGANETDFRHFYMLVEEPTLTHFGNTPAVARQMVIGVANDGDTNGTSTGGHLTVRSGTGYIMFQPERNNAGNNTFMMSVQESDSSSTTHGILSFGSVATQGGLKSALRFKKDTAEVQIIDVTNAEGTGTYGNLRADVITANNYGDVSGDKISATTFDIKGSANARIGLTSNAGIAQTFIASPQSNFLRLQDSNSLTYSGKQIQFASSTVIHKTNVRAIEDVDFDPILTLKTVPIFEYHSLFDIDNGDYFKKRIGVLREAVPEFMRDETTVDHWSMLGTLWQVNKIQQQEIETMRSELDQLKEMVALLSDKLN